MRNIFGGFAAKLRLMAFNYRSRRQLLALDSRALKDIGISRADALAEARKPFWKGQAGNGSDAGSETETTSCDRVVFAPVKLIAGCSVSLILVTVLINI